MEYIKVALEFLAMLGALALGLLAVVRYLLGKIENKTDDLHSRINEVKDTYLRKDDLMLHVGHIEATVADFKQENTRQHDALATAVAEQSRAMNEALERMHSRMDRFVDRGREDSPCAPSSRS